jgi:hypothetical protein
MTVKTQILYSAPGAGLGHLTRACAVSLQLRKEGISARIVTNSLFAEGLRRLLPCDIDFIPSHRWARDIPDYAEAEAVRPELVVTDTFPWGLRGEWRNCEKKGLRFATVARRLNLKRYLDAASLEWEPSSAHIKRVIAAEPLARDHMQLLRRSGAELKALPGRIRFPAESFPADEPQSLSGLFLNDRVWLVVHAGPEEEIRTLVECARRDMERAGGGVLAAILPDPAHRLDCSVFECFPASALYGKAFRVVTGAGYGSLADMAPWREKHICVPFPRRYDDQPGRFHGPPAGMADGTPEACRLLAEWL